MRRILLALASAGIVAALTAGVVLALNYEGEDFCQDTPSWPNGTYLGQMHPYHSDFYRGYAERRGWDPCVTWAQDQRNSAIRGIRELGYTVTEPEGGAPPPGPSATASFPTSSLPPVSLGVYSAVGGGHARSVGVAFSVSVRATRVRTSARTHRRGRMGPTWVRCTHTTRDFYRGFAERRGWDPCVTWAQDQRNSAIRGLRELGYTVIEPEGGAPPPGRGANASIRSHVVLAPRQILTFTQLSGGARRNGCGNSWPGARTSTCGPRTTIPSYTRRSGETTRRSCGSSSMRAPT